MTAGSFVPLVSSFYGWRLPVTPAESLQTGSQMRIPFLSSAVGGYGVPLGSGALTEMPAAPMAGQGKPILGCIAYVLYSSLPYLSTGYALRSHALAMALNGAGARVQCLTRPGFPWDERLETLRCPPLSASAATEIIGGIPYHRLPTPLNDSWLDYPAYVEAATEVLISKFTALRPALVMAASNHTCALPALRAARALGLPFVYEMRGMWELSRAAREPAFFNSAQFHYERNLETFVAQQADHVFVLSPNMRKAMIDRDVTPERITFLPNGCDPTRFGPAGRSADLRARLQIPLDMPIIGYAGSFPDYEGLEDLVSAVAALKTQGKRFRLILVGDENGTGASGISSVQALMQHAQTLNVLDHVLLTGRIDAGEVVDFLDLFDIVTVPRRSLPVTEMVAPLKPIEAMAAGKALLVSSVGGMDGMICNGKTGLSFVAGDISDLTDKLSVLLERPDLRVRLGQAARATVQAERTWDKVAAQILIRLDQLVGQVNVAP